MIKVTSFFYQELVPFIKRICWRTLSLIWHALLCSSCSQIYYMFKYKYYFDCILGIYFSQFCQLFCSCCSCSAFGFLFLQCSAFAFLHFVLLIWDYVINLSDSFFILISFSKLLAALPIQRNPQIFGAFSNSDTRVTAKNIECTQAQETLPSRDPGEKYATGLCCMTSKYLCR